MRVRKGRADYVSQNPTRDRKYAKLIEAMTGADKVVFGIGSVVIGADGWIEFEILKHLGPLETYAPVKG